MHPSSDAISSSVDITVIPINSPSRTTMVPSSETSDDDNRKLMQEDAVAGTPSSDLTIGVLMDHTNTNETLRAWFQRITQMQNDIQKKLHSSCTQSAVTTTSSSVSPAPQPSRVVKYQDLPYMGEMTLDNSKPRRGRKPKKADICHLIYKNYGTIFPGTPNPKSLVERDKKFISDSTISASASRISKTAADPAATGVEGLNRSDVQHRIISSLLEKRLTQESKRKHQQILQLENVASRKTKTISLARKEPSSSSSSSSVASGGGVEPLNLCVRDSDHRLQLRLANLTNNDVALGIVTKVEIKEEPSDVVEFVHGTSSLVPQEQQQDVFKATGETGAAPAGYVYWPHAGVFIHPIALQQQLLQYQQHVTPPLAPVKSETLLPASKEDAAFKGTIAAAAAAPAAEDAATAKKPKPTAATVKRKRSAIFIPPIPAENQNNPATEVSICKFKFTGGAKPSLQEKKMLSVDSGGNFRYYSGTGDKSMRGYEFFPRETLQQQINVAQGSSTGAFLQASGERILTRTNEFMLTTTPDPASTQLGDRSYGPTAAAAAAAAVLVHHKKRKSRKSLQREKLEQTFREKGFLIQTQQLESAEGATYCKFRQLRKFTRYLFRSWKDYLPGNVGENGGANDGHSEMVYDQEEEGEESESVSNLSSPSPPPPPSLP